MSYILDALKKSERERRRASSPDPYALGSEADIRAQKRSSLRYMILAALLLNALALAWWSGTVHTKKQGAKQVERNAESQIAGKSLSQQTVQKENGLSAEKYTRTETDHGELGSPKSAGVQGRLPAETETAPRKGEKIEGANREVSEKSDGAVISSSGEKEARTTSPKKTDSVQGVEFPAANPDPKKIYNLYELPLTVRQGLPEFSVSVFFYSEDPASRMARINGKTIREGEYLSHGLKLEQIIPNAVIFGYRDYHFRIWLR